MVRPVASDLWALPLMGSGIIPQEGRPVADNRCREVQRAGKGVAVASTKVPLRVKAAGAGKEFVVEKAGRQSRDRGINIHIVIVVVLLRNRPSKRVRGPRSSSREES
jgi:hypothetical protein